MNFGEKFKELVETSGESYENIAIALGLKSRSSVSHYMKSSALPKYDMLVKMCAFFKVSPSFFEAETQQAFSQPKMPYQTSGNEIPVYSDESINAVRVSYMSIPHTGITDGFAIVITDDRLENIGILKGSTVVLSEKFTLADNHSIIAQKGQERFFAKYEKIRENYGRIVPANPELTPVMFEAGKTTEVKIYAVVKYVLSRV